MNSVVSAIILAAGLGTRMKSKKAKVLHRAGGLTLVEHVVRTALTQVPAERITVVVGHQAEQVQQTLTPYGVSFARQAEQKGTGHAAACCAPTLREHGGYVVVLYGDTPLLSPATLAALLARQADEQAAGVVITTELEFPHGYGRIVRGADGNIAAIVEQKAATVDQHAIREINSGIYLFRADLLWDAVDRLQPNPASGEYYLTDVIEDLVGRGHTVVPLVLAEPNEVLGINTRVELATVDRLFRERTLHQLMLSGVTVIRPETVTVDGDVEIGRDTILGPFTQVLGNSVLGEDCVIGAGAILENVRLGQGVHVLPYTILADSVIGEEAHVGPFARLRMQNEVEAGAHIGNFVELKKTKFGRGSKASHLAYLGDSVVGDKVNVGAGTITCNYDGAKKHATHIGDGAFIGSNSTLVAPVEVGAGSYVAAGSVVTEAVPSGALALGRSRQVNKEGWVEKKRHAKTRE